MCQTVGVTMKVRLWPIYILYRGNNESTFMINHGLIFCGVLVSSTFSFFSIAEVKFSRVAVGFVSFTTLLLSSSLSPVFASLYLSMNVFWFFAGSSSLPLSMVWVDNSAAISLALVSS